MEISIKDILGIESLSLNLKAPISIIVGKNEAGKSSIRDAIQWCLTGTARGRKTHNEQADLIRNGAKSAEVNITQTSGVITRKKTPKSAPAVVGSVPKDEVMSAICCDPLTFLSFPENMRREIFFRLIPGLNPNRKDIVGRLICRLPEEISEEAICDSVGDLAKLAAALGFKEAENEAITRRRIAKALIKEAGNLEDPKQKATIGDKEYILPDFQEAQVIEGLANLQESRDELLQRRGKAIGNMDDLPKLEKELADLEANPIEPPKSGEVERLQAALEVSRRSLADLQKQVDSLGPGKAPKFFPVVCPVFQGFEIACPKARGIAVQGQKAADPVKAEKLQGFLKNETE